MDGLRARVRFLFEDLETPAGRAVDACIFALIILACLSFVIQTYEIPSWLSFALAVLEVVIGVSFTIEYLLRVWVAEHRLRYVVTPFAVIDLVAILPFLLAVPGLQFVRVFRLLRITRFLEHRHFFFGDISHDTLLVIRVLFTIFAIVFVSAGLVYHEEAGRNPAIENFFDAFYFSIVTLTTVGYGDITPVTESGRWVTVLIIAAGIVFIPWQVAALLRRNIFTGGKVPATCERCGLRLHDPDAVHCKHCGAPIYLETDGR